MVDAGKVDNALELVDRFHSEKSYDIAIRYADRHDKLATEIERKMKMKFVCEENDQFDFDQREIRFSNTFMNRNDVKTKQISPDSGQSQKRPIKLHRPAGIASKKHRVN